MLKGINRAADPANLNPTEQKHVPVIEAPGRAAAGEPFNVKVSVGAVHHVMEPAHFIEWVELWAGDTFLTRAEFTPANIPVVTVSVTLDESTTLRALERCNIHGLWEGTKEIAVG